MKPTNVKQAIPFLMVANMERSLHFYVDGLDFELQDKWTPNSKIVWCQLKLGKAAIMLQEYGINQKPNIKLGEGSNIYFICENALEIYHEAMAKGLSPNEPFVGNQMWVVGFNDPDGYILFFESSTDVSENTTYSTWKDTQ